LQRPAPTGSITWASSSSCGRNLIEICWEEHHFGIKVIETYWDLPAPRDSWFCRSATSKSQLTGVNLDPRRGLQHEFKMVI
jgi:hypothetical protein